MARIDRNELTCYDDCDLMLGNRYRKRLRYAVYLIREGMDILVVHHFTAIVRYRPDGRVIVTTDGWKTPTTKANINRYTSLHVWQEKGGWFYTTSGRENRRPFHDQMSYFATPDGVSLPR